MRTSVGSHSDGGEFLRKLHRYESQPLDTKRCNYCYQVGAFRRWRTAPGSIVKGLKPRRGVACYRELPRIPLLRCWLTKDDFALRFLVNEEHALAEPVRCGPEASLGAHILRATLLYSLYASASSRGVNVS